MSKTLKTDRLNLNFNDFDEHFNFYVSQSLNYLTNNTNMTLPVSDSSTNKTSIVDLVQYVRTVVSEPVVQGEDEMSPWNATLFKNSQYLESYDHFLSHVPSIRPWAVFILSVFERLPALGQLDLSQVFNQLLTVTSKVSSHGFSVVVVSFTNVYAWLLTLSNFAFNVFLYFTLTIYFLNDREDLVDLLFKTVKSDEEARNSEKQALKEAIKGVFTSTL